MSSVAALLTRGIAVTALAGATLVMLPAAAPARSLVHTDPRGDVTTIFGPSFDFIPAPGQVNGDVLRTRFSHTTNRVRVRMKFLDLHKADDVRYNIRVAVRTNEGVRREVRLDFTPSYWQGHAKMTRITRLEPLGEKVRCPIYSSVNDTKNVVVIGFPRTCLKGPRWIRIGAIGEATLREGASNNFLDDVLKSGTIGKGARRRCHPGSTEVATARGLQPSADGVAILDDVYGVVDTITADAIADCDYLRDFGRFVVGTTSADGETWTGRYLFGRRTYVGVRASDFQGLEEQFTCGIGLSTHNRGDMAMLAARVEEHDGEVVTGRTTRQEGDQHVPWFDHLSPPSRRGGSLDVHRLAPCGTSEAEAQSSGSTHWERHSGGSDRWA